MNTATTPNENDYKLIQRFFDFELEDAELAVVEQRMKTDADFLERMQLYEQMEKRVDEIGKRKDTIAHTAKTVKFEPRKARRFQLNTIRAAAAMLVLAIGCLFIFWMLSDNSGSSSSLADNYWNERNRTVSSIVKSDNNITPTAQTLLDAARLFEANDMPKTIETLSNIPVSDPYYAKATLLKGEALFEQEEYERAIEQFQTVRTIPDSEYTDLAAWYQALAYVKIGNIEAAKSNLNYIIEQQYPLQKKAKELLDNLK